MIEGLKFKMSNSELVLHLTARSKYHQQRADEKEAELPGLKETLDRLVPARQAASLQMMNKSRSTYGFDPDDPIEQLSTDIRNHRNSSLAFEFMASHLLDDDYTLTEADLKRLEILR